VHERLARRYGEDPGTWTGMAGSLAFDTLAAYLDHPVYPTARGRAGLTDDQLRAYAPEFHPTFTLRWATVHAPPCAPQCAPITLPVHPLTAGALPPGAVLTDRPGPEVIPTLSMRTVALARDPAQHIKLPLPTSTLGLRNRRTIKPGTLIDGAAGQRLLEAVIAREPRFRGTILQADEQRFDHAGHELLAALYRRYPPGLDSALIVPLAALLAPEPGGRRLIDRLADRFYDGDPIALLDAYLTLLFDWQTTLFSYGIALESHQQNTSLVLDRPHPAARTRLRLLFKDNDGPRVNAGRIRPHGLPADFDDPRTFTDHDQPLIDMFTTITVHLCAGALAFGLPAHRDRLLRLIRDRLDAMAGPVLRKHLLDADRLPVKAMVTAGTLLSKERSGAADINKHYTSGPNYLRRLPIS
jgi:siderophore synthetase component